MQFYTKIITGTGNPEPLSALLSDNALPRNPKKILVIIPKGHKLTLQQIPIKQWQPNGEVIEIDNTTGGASLFFEIVNFENDEAGISPNNHLGYTSLTLSFKLNEFGYLFVSY